MAGAWSTGTSTIYSVRAGQKSWITTWVCWMGSTNRGDRTGCAIARHSPVPGRSCIDCTGSTGGAGRTSGPSCAGVSGADVTRRTGGRDEHPGRAYIRMSGHTSDGITLLSSRSQNMIVTTMSGCHCSVGACRRLTACGTCGHNPRSASSVVGSSSEYNRSSGSALRHRGATTVRASRTTYIGMHDLRSALRSAHRDYLTRCTWSESHRCSSTGLSASGLNDPGSASLSCAGLYYIGSCRCPQYWGS